MGGCGDEVGVGGGVFGGGGGVGVVARVWDLLKRWCFTWFWERQLGGCWCSFANGHGLDAWSSG